MTHTNSRRAFTLVEILVVLAIVSLLAALLFPVFLTVRGKARESVCGSNLRQIGQGIVMYAADSDGRFPHAVDPSDRAMPAMFDSFPDFAPEIPRIGQMHEVLQPYLKSTQIFACPADTGFMFADFSGAQLDAFPSSFEKFGTSYYYRTELAARKMNESGVQEAARINMMFDGVGHWHGTLTPIAGRYNTLFADGHVKNLSRDQIGQAWSTPLQSPRRTP